MALYVVTLSEPRVFHVEADGPEEAEAIARARWDAELHDYRLKVECAGIDLADEEVQA